MSFRFDFGRNPAVDSLFNKACDLRRSLSVSPDRIEREQNSSLIAEAEQVLCHDLAREPGTTKLNGNSLARIFLSLAYSDASWFDFDTFFKYALLDSVHTHHETMSAKNAANTLWALARMGCPTNQTSFEPYLDSEVTDCLLQILYQRSDDFIIQTCSNVLWSFASLDFDYADIELLLPYILCKIYAEMERDTQLARCEAKCISQLKDFLDYYKHQFSEKMKQDIFQLTLCVNHRIKEMAPPHSSATHREVEKVLRRCTTSVFQSEVSIGGGYADICFVPEKVVFEFNGPTHYEKDGRTLNAHSRFRQRLMKKNGYSVYHINYLDWQNAKNRENFIRDLSLVADLPIRTAAPQPSLTIFMPPQGPSIVVESTTPVFFITIPRDPPKKRPRDEEDDREIRDVQRAPKYARY